MILFMNFNTGFSNGVVNNFENITKAKDVNKYYAYHP